MKRPIKFFTKKEKKSIIVPYVKWEKLKMILFRFFKPKQFIRFYRYRVCLMWRNKRSLEFRDRAIRRHLVLLHTKRRANLPGNKSVWVGSGNQKSKKEIRKLIK